MCGIAGILKLDRSKIDSQLLKSVSSSLYTRGPDDFGFLGWSGESPVQLSRNPDELQNCLVGLVHRRLSILDLSEAGWQPMVTPDGRYAIVFNGEIYNYLELQAELKALGHTFHSHSDTEVLLTAYAHWGNQALNRLVGMFAFAILDTQKRSIFIARDFFGIKPLYYTHWHNGFAFASEIKALLEFPGLNHRINPQRLYDYLCLGLTDQGGETLLADIRQLPAAHYLEFSLDAPYKFDPVRYWQVNLNQRLEISFEEAAEQLRELFLNSVKLHLRSDVAVGAALSGGIDSSSIVMAMRYLEPDLEIHTFSYLADDPKVSEEQWMKIVSKAANSIMHTTQPTPTQLVEDLNHLIQVQDEPFGSTSIYAQNRVFRLAQEAGIKVMLDGQGADEMLGGYSGYLGARLASLIRQGQLGKATQFLQKASSLPNISSLKLLLIGGGFLLPENLQGAARDLVGKSFTPSWLNSTWFTEQGVMLASTTQNYKREVFWERLKHDLENSLISLLRYEDRNSMAFSIESRVPFLTPTLVNFMFSLPEEYIIAPDGTSKAVFRRAMRGIVPDTILNRRDKIGFATPEFSWLTALSPWVEEVLHSKPSIPVLKIDVVEREWRAVIEGRKPFNFRIWRWLNLIRWAEKYAVNFG
ncbi:asparagine synthase (glutamine-hydrolyzing) [Anabaena lutea]|uniref:asparagine synthase (glutamine-hydrolyzing) n=1 Tax=Anabaena lutea FACHB-196 TaxID=2692881 RepID=A0ABR8FHD1_9NOST|nr:asparagine synthase (glutamine-hydrolyzing) [Anabaena lutea]MBD2569388.1 asparagine synthase (glutamine-hydrolyzing) [Anabaena lutea FACHB-196]